MITTLISKFIIFFQTKLKQIQNILKSQILLTKTSPLSKQLLIVYILSKSFYYNISVQTLSYEKLLQEPATRWFDWSFTPVQKYHNDLYVNFNELIGYYVKQSLYSSPPIGNIFTQKINSPWPVFQDVISSILFNFYFISFHVLFTLLVHYQIGLVQFFIQFKNVIFYSG